MTLNPLTGGQARRRGAWRRGALALMLVLSVAATAAVVALGLELGSRVGSNLDRSTVVTAGIPPQPAPEEETGRAPMLAFGPRAVEPRLRPTPRAAVLFDVGSGEVLWSRRAHDVVPIASLTKVMTALLVTERTSPRERAKVTRDALDYSGSGVGVLPRGRRVPVSALLNGLLLVSGNDAAIALADHVARSTRAFVDLMNRRAGELGLRCTHFASPHGLENANRSCAADLGALARLALREPRIARITRRRQVAVRFPIRGGRLYLNSTNPLLRLRYRGTIGLKTGYTRKAGHNFIGVVQRRGRTLGLVLLNSRDTGAQARLVFDTAFGRAQRARGQRPGEPFERTRRARRERRIAHLERQARRDPRKRRRALERRAGRERRG
ncbi:MAG TPA: serine hydrolase [Thermoleophilaceae bacterium]|nr:serine hydrolase [Thermoleophilaceae bacterium]